jgi:hypothetical protein
MFYMSIQPKQITTIFTALKPHLNEKTRRLLAAAMTLNQGTGIKGEVSKAAGVSYREIRRGLVELKESVSGDSPKTRIRLEGGGRKKQTDIDSSLMVKLEYLVESTPPVVIQSRHYYGQQKV